MTMRITLYGIEAIFEDGTSEWIVFLESENPIYEVTGLARDTGY